MKTLAILPVKSFAAAKQRLAGQLGTGSRQALAQAMLSDTLGSLRHVRGIDATVVVTRDLVAEGAALGRGVAVLRDREEAGQSAAALVGIRHALAQGFERVLLVPGDTPLVDAGEVSALLARAEDGGPCATIVPDRHGTGTNALVLTPPDAIQPSFGPASFERHGAAARAAGIRHAVEEVPSLALDVDTPEDLAELATRLDQGRGRAPMTRGALRQLDRSRVRGSVPARRGREAAPARA
jgi:2-phospho-L-lactate/phosphoenolpyruvate guanylyltransferase